MIFNYDYFLTRRMRLQPYFCKKLLYDEYENSAAQ